jgi:hypothetical protein
MPDVHWGMGASVGSVIATKGAIVPAAVGVDIGCGMAAAMTSLTAADLPDSLVSMRSAIEAVVPHGRTDNGGKNDPWCLRDDDQLAILDRITERGDPAIHIPFFLEAAILSRTRSPMTSRSNWAKDSRMLRVSRPIDVVVLNCWVTATKVTPWRSNTACIGSLRELAARPTRINQRYFGAITRWSEVLPAEANGPALLELLVLVGFVLVRHVVDRQHG